MSKILVATVTALLLSPAMAFAEGFGLIEYTTEGVAMSGAAMFIENDAGNMAYNPVGITKCEGEQVKVSLTYISPEAKYDAFGKDGSVLESGHNRVHPAWAPGSYYVRKVNDKEWYGLGCFSRFGNMCDFEAGTVAATNNRFAKVMGLSITPTYARKAGDKWFWAVGADINYAGLTLEKDFTGNTALSSVGTNETKGESWALGWNMGLRYAASDKDEFGLAYRSKIKHNLSADFYSSVTDPMSCWSEVTLPDSYHLGYSHKFDSKNRVELSAIRTNWSVFDSMTLHFGQSYLGRTESTSYHNWKDGWRYAIGYEHHFSKKYTGMLGFSFDEGGIPYDGGDFMVPMGCRRTYSIGLKYHDKRHTLACSFAWMSLGALSFAGNGLTDGYASAHSHDNSTKIISVGYAYHF